MDKLDLNKLLERTPIVVILIGVIILIVGAAGGLPIGSPPLQITDWGWRLALGAMGLVLVSVGLLLLIRDSKKADHITITETGELQTNKKQEAVSPAPETSSAQRLTQCGLSGVFRITVDNAARLRRVRELIEQEAKSGRKLRLAASSGFSYLNPNGPVWKDAGLGRLVTTGAIEIDVVLESPFSHFAITRALANNIITHHWQEKLDTEALVRLLQYSNIAIHVTDVAVNCSLFFTGQSVYYDPYLWALPHPDGRTENNFWVFEFAKMDGKYCKDCASYSQIGKNCDCYTVLEQHFAFLRQQSTPLEELLHKPRDGGAIPRGREFYNLFRDNPNYALNQYSSRTKEFSQKLSSMHKRSNT